MTAAPEVSTEELAGLFLFERLEPEQLSWLANQGGLRVYSPGASIYAEGEPAEAFFVLLEGQIELRKQVQTEQVVLVRTDQPGAYAGAVRAFVAAAQEQAYANSMIAMATSRMFRLPAAAFATMVRDWFPMAMHLLDGLYLGVRNAETQTREREKLIALGQLSAGLAHELNNPAAAGRRAGERLLTTIPDVASGLAQLAAEGVDADGLQVVAARYAELSDVTRRPQLSPVAASDAEDALGEVLEAAGVHRAWELAADLAQAGLSADGVAEIRAGVGEPAAGAALRWLAAALSATELAREASDAASRISTLVGAIKQYSGRDTAPEQEVDLRDGLESTLVMLGPKLSGLQIVRRYDAELPRVPVRPAMLNQVWTNLLDNAAMAMGGAGHLTVTTRRDGEMAVVDIADTGPGIPTDLQERVFEAFFTTKEVGQGTGLGLDISRRIVVFNHGGSMTVRSQPGETVFSVRLPLSQPIAPPVQQGD